MERMPPMVSMELTPDEIEASGMCLPADAGDAPKYPYGLSISLTQAELGKLGLDDDDVQVGDLLHMHAMAKVTSISKTDTESNGPKVRIELQIVAMEGEDEEAEDAEAETQMSGADRMAKLYTA